MNNTLERDALLVLELDTGMTKLCRGILQEFILDEHVLKSETVYFIFVKLLINKEGNYGKL